MLRRLLKPGARPHVCVVGAGIAGLRSAAVLINHGVKVTMFEGRNRIGGRVRVLSVLSSSTDYPRFIKMPAQGIV